MEHYKWLIVAVRLVGGPLLGAVLGVAVASGVIAPEVLREACARALASASASSSSIPLPLRSAGQLN